ncbi:MAG TPA: hypothetical protein VML55_21255 [Planctomycetaceae bacterium]|nr:hypothetical protein [Planctomycetaceae bacterium]
MKSFRLDRSARTHPLSAVVAWIAAGALLAVVAFRVAVLAMRDREWYIAPDPSPDHWTRSLWATAAVGAAIGGLIAAGCATIARRRRAPR